MTPEDTWKTVEDSAWRRSFSRDCYPADHVENIRITASLPDHPAARQDKILITVEAVRKYADF
jgi:hypothetical protein